MNLLYPRTLAAAVLLAFLAASARAVTLFPTDDTYSTLTLTGKPPMVTKTLLASATGASAYLDVSETHTAFVRFNAAAALSGVSVSKATLTIYFVSVTKPGALDVDVVTSQWHEKFTGPDVPEPGYAATGGYSISETSVVSKQFVSIDVTPTVQAWAAETTADFGFAILSPDKIASVLIGSKEGSSTGYPCVLQVELTDASAPTYGTAGIFTGTVTASGLSLSATSGATAGVISQGGASLLQTFGTDNFFAGSGAGNFTTTGANNTATGADALRANKSGANNTASGVDALTSNTTGGNNTALGAGAMSANGIGASNTAVGAGALSVNSSGSNNIALGANAGNLLTLGNFNIDIGNAGVAGESGVIRIGAQGAQSAAYIAGIVGTTTSDSGSTVPVMIDQNGNLGTVQSSRRYKEEIADMGDLSERLQRLRPVTFRYKKPSANGERPVQFGLIAEEVAEVFPELTVFNAQGQPETVKYQDLAPLLLNEFLKEHRQVEEQKSALQEAKAALAEQAKQIQSMASRLEQTESLLRQLNGRVEDHKAATAF